MKGVRRTIAATVFVVLTPLGMWAQERTTLLVPAFEGPESLGRNVAAILGLEVWEALGFPTMATSGFRAPLLRWDATVLQTQTHATADRLGRRPEVKANLVLWGGASRYGDGAVVQAQLTVVSPTEAPIWDVEARGASKRETIGVTIPRKRYGFRPISLTNRFVQQYSSSGSLKLYRSVNSTDAVGAIGGTFTPISRSGSATLVEANGIKGWVRLPSISGNHSDVVDFVSGVTRIVSSNWREAETLFRKVIANAEATTALKVDAYLYCAVARERQGLSGRDDLQRAYALNPYDKTVTSYMLLGKLAELKRVPSSDVSGRRGVRDEARRLLTSSAYLYPRGDAWLSEMRAILGWVQ
jgi:hypothetical protein